MELSIYSIVKRALMTNKTVELYKKLGQLTFEVDKNANKLVIKNAVEKIWNVKVESVRTVTLPGKNKVFARRSFVTPGIKKAIVTLKKGYSIEIPGMAEATMIPKAIEPSAEIEGK